MTCFCTTCTRISKHLKSSPVAVIHPWPGRPAWNILTFSFTTSPRYFSFCRRPATRTSTVPGLAEAPTCSNKLLGFSIEVADYLVNFCRGFSGVGDSLVQCLMHFGPQMPRLVQETIWLSKLHCSAFDAWEFLVQYLWCRVSMMQGTPR